MGTISHKHVDDDLTDRIKLAALHAKKTVREYTLDVLTAAVARDLDAGPPAVDAARKKDVARAAAPVVPASELPSPERHIEYEE